MTIVKLTSLISVGIKAKFKDLNILITARYTKGALLNDV